MITPNNTRNFYFKQSAKILKRKEIAKCTGINLIVRKKTGSKVACV